MTQELRERVARAMAATHGYEPDALTYREADAAIAIIRGETLEEAARVCESELVEPSDRWMSGYSDACKENAAAIRALKEGK